MDDKLTTNKSIEFDGTDLLQLLPQSRIGFIGFWLVLAKEEQGIIAEQQAFNRKKYRRFIFIDSLSNVDRARLSRTILKVKNTSLKQVTL